MPGKMNKTSGKRSWTAVLACAFLGILPTTDAHRLRLNVQGRGDRGAEAFGLDQNRRELRMSLTPVRVPRS